MSEDFTRQALNAVIALGLSMARMLGCASFIPGFGRSHMTALHRNAVAMAIGMPQTMLIWHQLRGVDPTAVQLGLLGLKEALIGCLLGLLLATPYWAFRSAFTLVDNQRGANAAQINNPSMQADSSVMGELAERAFTVLLVKAGLFAVLLEAIMQSYELWPALESMPRIFALHLADTRMLVGAFVSFMTDALLYSAPVLALLLLIEFGFAVASTAAQGIPIYEIAMPVKSLAAMFCIAAYFRMLIDYALPRVADWWGGGMFAIFQLQR